MSRTKRVRNCVWTIIALALVQTVLLAASPTTVDPLVIQLRNDLDLIWKASVAIVTALSATIVVLWFALRADRKEFVEMLKEITKK